MRRKKLYQWETRIFNQIFIFFSCSSSFCALSQSLLSRTLVPMLRGDTVAADRVYNEAIAR